MYKKVARTKLLFFVLLIGPIAAVGVKGGMSLRNDIIQNVIYAE